eukprot:885991-Rhodomonas_salina.2
MASLRRLACATTGPPETGDSGDRSPPLRCVRFPWLLLSTELESACASVSNPRSATGPTPAPLAQLCLRIRDNRLAVEPPSSLHPPGPPVDLCGDHRVPFPPDPCPALVPERAVRCAEGSLSLGRRLPARKLPWRLPLACKRGRCVAESEKCSPCDWCCAMEPDVRQLTMFRSVWHALFHLAVSECRIPPESAPIALASRSCCSRRGSASVCGAGEGITSC